MVESSGVDRAEDRVWTATPLGRRLVAAVLASVTGFYGWLIHDRVYFGNDDLVQFSAAREHGLSGDLLGLIVFQHFGPYNRFMHLLVIRYFDLSTVVGAVLVTVNAAVLLGCLAWLCRETGLSALRTSTVIVLVGTSIVLADVGVFFDAGMHVLPAIAITTAIVACHVHAVRTGSWRWHAGTAVLFALGQLTQERPLFALPVLVLVDVLVLWRSHRWRTRIALLWGLRWPLAVLTLMAAAAAALLQVFVVEQGGRTPTWDTTGRTMLSALVNHVVPALVNLQPDALLSTGGQVAALVALVAAGAAVWRLSPASNGGPVLLAAASFLLYYVFLKASPLLDENSIEFTAGRLSNAAYSVVLAVFALAHVEAGAIGRWLRERIGPVLRPRIAVLAVVVVAAAMAHGAVVHLDERAGDASTAHDYLDQLADSQAEWTDPQVTVLPLAVTPEITTGWAAPLGRHEWFLRLVHPGFDENDLGPRPVVVDAQGDVQAVELVPESTFAVPAGSCGGDAGLVLGPLVRPVSGDALFVQLTYRASEDLDAAVLAGAGPQQTANTHPVHLPPGEHTRLFPVEAPAWDSVALRVPPGAGDLCIERASVVRPVIAPAGPGGECSTIDRYGSVVGTEPCPGR